MKNAIDEMTEEELVAKCVNQRIEIKNLLTALDRTHRWAGERETAVRIAIKHLKANCPRAALCTLDRFQREWDGREILRELANGKAK